jgi:ABC-type antimicrobial peptide transport system permease subunit
MSLDAQAGHVPRRVTTDVCAVVIAGALAGLVLGFAAVRYIESLLYQVNLVFPPLTILVAALLAALPPVIRAVRIDPVTMLRTE